MHLSVNRSERRQAKSCLRIDVSRINLFCSNNCCHYYSLDYSWKCHFLHRKECFSLNIGGSYYCEIQSTGWLARLTGTAKVPNRNEKKKQLHIVHAVPCYRGSFVVLVWLQYDGRGFQ